MGYADHPAYVWTMFVTVAIDAFQCIPFAYLRYKKRPLKFAAFKLLFIAMNIVLNLVYYVIMDGHDVGYAFYINLVCTGSITFCFYKELLEGFKGEKASWAESKVLIKKMLGYFSGFHGENSNFVVTMTESAVWADGRYFVQAEKEIAGTEIQLMRMGEPGVPTAEEYCGKVLPESI